MQTVSPCHCSLLICN